MGQVYRTKIWTTQGDHIINLNGKYELMNIIDDLNRLKPDAVITIGDIAIRAGNFVAARIIEELKEEEA